MGAKGAVEILRKREIAMAKDPASAEAAFTEEYRERFANPYVAAERGYVDDVIRPSETRKRLIDALTMLKNKVQTLPRKKHGNLPL
jgi:propionyl-CoA carboxylase beta chain